ncbi:S-adenosyl-L-methionine-dependent methyltransferase [Penicillium concentricum]|uniref:catechol O-methyltransferase n=1 Tax=Penicillium concentricum TaxID=293559 RepID=A0A9W9S944_9EURO|nr:S-adenosyl-L-methionine-dependent methyltransferase [Penicillium concentricum]KAJ5372904.1 S-adenosyl-L-methionine-dependent methyltransferase [Penicillium concentricum]
MLSSDLTAKYPSLNKFVDVNDVESHDGREVALLKYIYNHHALDELRGSPSAILGVIDEFAAQEEFLINIGPDKAAKVREIIQQEKPTVMVELGGYVGYSAIYFGEAMRQAQEIQKGLRLWSLEFDPLVASIAMNLIELAGLSDIVKVVVGSASDSLKRLAKKELVDIDLLFLDHVEDLYVADLKICEELGLLKPGALVVADNILRPGAPKYREYVRHHAHMQSWAIKGLIVPGDFEVSLAHILEYSNTEQQRMNLKLVESSSC